MVLVEGKTMSKGRVRKASAIDVHVGRQLRLKRQLLGISQQELGEKLGITFQQMQKYEKGTNRISAGRLFELSRILNVEVSWFYEGIAGERQMPSEYAGDAAASALLDPVALRAAQSLMRIKDRKIRLRLVKTIEALAEE